MDAAETDIARSKCAKIIYRAEGWSLSCSVEEAEDAEIITRFPNASQRESKEGAGRGLGVLIGAYTVPIPFLLCSTFGKSCG